MPGAIKDMGEGVTEGVTLSTWEFMESMERERKQNRVLIEMLPSPGELIVYGEAGLETLIWMIREAWGKGEAFILRMEDIVAIRFELPEKRD